MKGGMNMFEKILVCLDGSKLAEQILPYAKEQALRFKSKITLLQVVTLSKDDFAKVTSRTLSDESQMVQKWIQQAKSDAEEYLERVRKSLQAKGLEIECAVLHEEPVGEAIVKYANKNNFGLIAIATHGRGGLGRLVFGSVASHMISESSLPILVIKPRDET